MVDVIASVSATEAVLALLILAVVYLMGAVMWWDLSETCREQVGAGDDTAAVRADTPYDWAKEGAA